MKKINKKTSKYMFTFLYSLLAVVLLFCVLQVLIFVNMNKSKQVKNVQLATPVDYEKLINSYKELELKDSQNHEINQKLAEIYKKTGNDLAVEKEYEKIIKKTGGRHLESFQTLAELYIKSGKYDEAIELIDGIKYIPLKKSLIIKKNFYTIYANALFEAKEYEKALDAYNNTIYLRKRLNRRADFSDIRENVINTYIALSHKCVKNNNLEDAINYILTALNYKQTPDLYYDLALLYMNKDAKIAVNYFEKTRRLNPVIVNYDLYLKALKAAKNIAEQKDGEAAAAIYAIRYRMIEQYVKNMFASKDDFAVLYSSIDSKKQLLTGKKTFNLNFKIENKNNYLIRHLFMIVEVYDNGKMIYKSDYVVTEKEPLAANEITSTFDVKFDVPKNKQHNLICKIFITKNRQVPMTEISSIKINF